MSNDSPYQFSWSPRALAAVKVRLKSGIEPTSSIKLSKRIRAIDERLRRDPFDFGEVYRSRGNVAEHLGLSGIVAVDFAIDSQRKFVVVRDCRFLSERGS